MKTNENVIDAYIAGQDETIQPFLRTVCTIVREEIPDAEETIAYGMPTFRRDKNLIHFAAHTRHVGLYPGVDAIEHFAAQLTDYKTSKGAIQLPLSKPIPIDLVREIAAYCGGHEAK